MIFGCYSSSAKGFLPLFLGLTLEHFWYDNCGTAACFLYFWDADKAIRQI
jgi:hypothetical protein